MNKSAFSIFLLFFFIVFTVLIQPARAQAPQMQWEKTYTTGERRAIVQSNNGGYAIVAV